MKGKASPALVAIRELDRHDVALLEILSDLDAQCFEFENAAAWCRLELLGLVEIGTELVVLLPLGKAAVELLRRKAVKA